MMIGRNFLLLFSLAALSAASPGFGQTKRAKPPTKAQPPIVQPTPAPEVVETPRPTPPSKKNGRPASGEAAQPAAIKPPIDGRVIYDYEFTRPAFVISFISIRHDENGKGTIVFRKRGLENDETEPIMLSSATLFKIDKALAALNFLDSTESYQYEKDYPHLGNITFTIKKDGRSRTTKFNWTENKDARVIADEYRRIANQYIWQFDMAVARENQPLESPQLMDTLDGYIRRGEISDPKQMLPLLRTLSNDERIPLIARNHAAKLASQIEKAKD